MEQEPLRIVSVSYKLVTISGASGHLRSWTAPVEFIVMMAS